ncbi:MAG: glycosyltransferase family 2 protein [Halobacteriovoraceae bacterium]|nr:glycosyltransferase family 2 protein [Halobacteriovoraceae bacterium]
MIRIASKLFFVFSSIVILLFVSIVFYANIFTKWEFDIVSVTLTKMMVYYLFFVFFKTGIYIIFSFLDFIYKIKLKGPEFYPLVSLIIPCFNEENVIEKAIESGLKLNYPNLELVVVDDGSTDNTLEVAKKYEDDLRVRIIYKENGGKAMALNRGIYEANGDYVLCMDADSILDKDCLMKAIPYFQNDSKIAALAGNVVVGNDKSILTMFQKLEYVIGLNFYKRAQSFLGIVTIVPGPIGVFKKDVIYEIGGYRSNTFAEDCDLTLRILAKGYQIKYSNDVIAVTEVPEDMYSLMIQRYRWSRGITQAIKESIRLLNNKKNFLRNLLITTIMIIESIFIPVVNFSFLCAAIGYALIYDTTQFLGPYFIGLTLLDLTLSFYSILTERQIIGLTFLAAINRVTFGLWLEVLRFLALVDELLLIPMNWGKLKRKGLN